MKPINKILLIILFIALVITPLLFTEVKAASFNSSKTTLLNLTFNNFQSLNRSAEWVTVFINLNATTNLTIGFTAKNIVKNGQNYTLSYTNTTPTGINDLQLVNGSFSSENREVGIYIYNSTAPQLQNRNYSSTIANTFLYRTPQGTGTAKVFGNANNNYSMGFSSDGGTGDGGLGRITQLNQNLVCTGVGCQGDGTSGEFTLYNDNAGGYYFGNGGAATCKVDIDTSVIKKISCNQTNGFGKSSVNYTVYTDIDYLNIEYSTTDRSRAFSLHWGQSAFNAYWDSTNYKQYFAGGQNLTNTTFFNNTLNENVTAYINNETFLTYLILSSSAQGKIKMSASLSDGGDWDIGSSDSSRSNTINGNQTVEIRLGSINSGMINGTRAIQEYRKYKNPLIINSTQGISATSGGGTPNTAPRFNSGYPQINSTDGSNSSTINLNAFFTATDDENTTFLYNVTWILNNRTNFTTTSSSYMGGDFANSVLDYHNLTAGQTWKAQIQLFDGQFINRTNTTELLILSVPSIPTLDFPVNNFVMTGGDVAIGCSGSTSPSGNTVRYEIYVQKNTNPPTTLMSNATTTGINYTTSGDGTYFWRCRANDAISGTQSGFTSTRLFIVDSRFIMTNMSIANSTAVYSSKQVFTLNVTYNTTVSDINALFIFNNQSYSVTETDWSSNGKLFVSSPVSINTKSVQTWNWNLTIVQPNGTSISNNSFTGITSIVDDNFALCNSTLTSPTFLNVTFSDESTGLRIQNITIDSSTFSFYVDDSGLAKSYSFLNTTFNSEYDFCGSPAYTYLRQDITGLVYKSGTAYPARTYSNSILTTNATYGLNLLLLSSSSGTYVTFQVVNAGGQTLQNVLVTATTSSQGLVSSTYTDAAGTTTIFMNPNLQYTMSFSKSGYTTQTQLVTPSLASYTITMVGSSASSPSSAQNITEIGIKYDIGPAGFQLVNNTNYTFYFNISSSVNSLNLYGFKLVNASGFFFAEVQGSNPTGSLLQTSINTLNYSSIIMNYYYIINGSSFNGTKTWIVGNFYVGSGSLLNFCQDLQNFKNKPEFGQGADFTFALIAFGIIFLLTASISFISGIYSPISISGMILAGTSFFDFCGGFIPNIGIIDHFITYLLGLVFIIFIIQEFITTK